jgi:hypothetical protein
MDENLNIVARRREEVLGNMAKARAVIENAKKVISDGESELLDLDVAGRTLARLTGASWPQAGEGDSTISTSNIGRVLAVEDASVKPTMPEMIEAALNAAHGVGAVALEPKTIAAYVERIFNNKPDGAYVSSIVWRMWKRGQLVKIGAGAYGLPGQTNEASDLLSGRDEPEASDQEPGAQGGEARPGGGT